MMIGPVPAETFLHAAAFAAMSIFFMFLGKVASDAITPYNDDREVRDKMNLAVALRTAGLYGGLVIGLAGALAGDGGWTESTSTGAKFLEFFIDGFVVILLLLVAKAILHFITLRGLRPISAAKEGNIGVGLVECCAYLATGLIINGAFNDGLGTAAPSDSSLVAPIIAAVIYSFIGQVALAGSFALAEAFTRWNIGKELLAANPAAGLYVGAKLLGIGMILRVAISGPMNDWGTDLTAFGLFFVFGMAMLAIANWLGDLLFLPRQKVADAVKARNVAAIAKVAGVQLAVALVVSSAL
jgi:uncharacterized membrane protein YjfL (UPF0719 family)